MGGGEAETVEGAGGVDVFLDKGVRWFMGFGVAGALWVWSYVFFFLSWTGVMRGEGGGYAVLWRG